MNTFLCLFDMLIGPFDMVFCRRVNGLGPAFSGPASGVRFYYLSQAWIWNLGPFNNWAGLRLSDGKPQAGPGPTRTSSDYSVVTDLKFQKPQKSDRKTAPLTKWAGWLART